MVCCISCEPQTYNIVMCKRLKLNSYEPFVRDKNMKFVTHSWYNKTLSFGTPFEFLKTYKIFQCVVKLCRHLLDPHLSMFRTHLGGAQDKEHAYGIPTRTAVVNDSDVPVPELD